HLLSLTIHLTHPPSTHLHTLSLHDALPILALINIFGDVDAVEHRAFKLLDIRIFSANGVDQIVQILENQPVSTDDLANFINFARSEEHTSELQSRFDLVCRLLLEKKRKMVV